MSAQTTGSLTATGSVALTKPDTDTLTMVQISGTYGTVTFVFEGTLDGTNWFAVAAIRYDTGAIVNGTLSPADNAELAWKVPSEGLAGVRARVTAIASGTAAFALNSASFVGLPFTANQQTGTDVTGLWTATGGIDFPDSALASFGTSDDVTMRWDGVDFDILAAADDSVLKIGNGTNSFDVWIYGQTAGAYLSWDASANDLKAEDSVSLMFGTGAGAGPGTAGDVEMRWDGTDFDILAAADDLVIKFGTGTNSFDIWVYGNTASDYILWDASASVLTGVGAGQIRPFVALTDPGNAGAIPVTNNGYCALVTVGAETRTLAAPGFIGQELILYLKTDGGDCVVTCTTTFNETGNNTATFADTGDSLRLTAVEEGANLRWRCPVADGHSLTTV